MRSVDVNLIIAEMHSGDNPITRSYAGIAVMVRSHPDVTFVAAHLNERADFQELLTLMDACPNLYLDLSGAGIFRYGAIAYGVRRVGSERLLFGTDYPICNPRMYVHTDIQ